MTFTDKFDLEETSYSQSGWNAVVWANFQKVDAGLDSRLPVMTAGEALAQYEAVYLNPSTGKVELALADGSQQPCIGLAAEAADTDGDVRIQREGAVTNAGWSWTVGDTIYLSGSTSGGLTATRPTANAQILGYALAATVMVLERQSADLGRVMVCEENADAGGTFTQDAWQTRVINTVHHNSMAGAGLASNKVTLPPGRYVAKWSAPAYQVGTHTSRLYNVTAAAAIRNGSSETCGTSVSVVTRSQGEAVFSLAAESEIRVEHYCFATKANSGFGVDCVFLATNIYTMLEIVRVG